MWVPRPATPTISCNLIPRVHDNPTSRKGRSYPTELSRDIKSDQSEAYLENRRRYHGYQSPGLHATSFTPSLTDPRVGDKRSFAPINTIVSVLSSTI